jgi:hypothetical protein
METYTTTEKRPSGKQRTRERWVCKPCTATAKRIGYLKRQERWDELERAIEAGEHSRAARIQANSGQTFGYAQTA